MGKFTRATENLENFKNFQTANVTRWNSKLKMIGSLSDILQNKIDVLNTVHKLSLHERSVLKELRHPQSFRNRHELGLHSMRSDHNIKFCDSIYPWFERPIAFNEQELSP